MTPFFAGGVGVVLPDFPELCSPSRINASTVLSRLPLRPLSTVELRLSSGKPMSLSVASFESSPSPEVCMLDPKTRDGLFTRGGEVCVLSKPRPGDTGGDLEVDVFLNPNPKRPVGFGGSGGGLSSELVLPVLFRVPGCTAPMNTRCSYFCRMYRSIAPSTSSTSMGMWAFAPRGLYVLFDSALPMRFMFWCRQRCLRPARRDCSYIDLRIVPLVHAQRLDLRDVRPQLAVQRRAAHAQEDAQLCPSVPRSIYARVRRAASSGSRRSQQGNIRSSLPILPAVSSSLAARALSLPGFLAPQSAQVPLPGTVLISSCSVRSLRACWRLFSAEAILSRRELLRHTRIRPELSTRRRCE